MRISRGAMAEALGSCPKYPPTGLTIEEYQRYVQLNKSIDEQSEMAKAAQGRLAELQSEVDDMSELCWFTKKRKMAQDDIVSVAKKRIHHDRKHLEKLDLQLKQSQVQEQETNPNEGS